MCGWRDVVFEWLEERPELVEVFLRRERLEALCGGTFRRLEEESARGRFAMPVLRKLAEEWMVGSTLARMEVGFGTRGDRLEKCKAAREFALRIVPDLAFFFGVASQVVRAQALEGGGFGYDSVSVETLASCVREGFDRPEKLALRWIRGNRVSRVAVHREFAQLSRFLDPPPESEDFAALRRRMRRAVRASERDGD